ncbi:DUF899 family protein [Microvirga sp. 2TAF3]|uniref:DUF899 family protein n=1 Tax=Microvirga sp. 2TAF3 TaxID=3233014 RepID=UPI003F9E71DA
MKYRDAAEKLAGYRSQIADIREKMRNTQASIEPEEVEDYEFATARGRARMSSLFGDKDTLLVIHNMGTGCASCTMWADGFNGVYEHLRDRAAFVVSSPDAPERQQSFAAGRGWKFPMISNQGTTFAEDMGYRPNGRAMPGVSVFRRKGGKILRVADTGFAHGDDFCSVWHLFDLIPEGKAGWLPKFSYAS